LNWLRLCYTVVVYNHFHFFSEQSLIVGILHPDPEFNFPIRLFPSVPFLRMKKWPPEKNIIETEWIIYKPKPEEFYHRKVEFEDKELRSI
jgi:hypothetical protein